MTVRHAPSYSSNSQGSVERLHRTLLGQVRVVKAQVESNYSMTMSTKHCLLPWIVRHAAWTVNRYVIHSDGYTSFEHRWGRNYERAICEFGETLLYPCQESPGHRPKSQGQVLRVTLFSSLPSRPLEPLRGCC